MGSPPQTRARHHLAAIVALIVTLPCSAMAHGPGSGDIRPQWLIDAMGALDRWRERREAKHFFEALYGKHGKELEPLFAPNGPCGASPLATAWREMTGSTEDGAVVLQLRPDYDVFVGMGEAAIADQAMQTWSWDACVHGTPRRMQWRNRDGGLLAAVDEYGVAQVRGEDGVVHWTKDPGSELVMTFPCQVDSDCVLVRDSCAPGRQRSAFAKRAPYFNAWRAALERELTAAGACAVQESPPYDAMVAICRDARCDVQLPQLSR